jgi:hypothetical protein
MLGNWEAAYKDFCKAQLSDFDEDVQTWCKEVEANVYPFLFVFFFSVDYIFLHRPRRFLNINANMNDVEKRKRPMLNENAFVKLKKLMLKHNKKKMNDEHKNNKHTLQVVNNSQDFQVTLRIF